MSVLTRVPLLLSPPGVPRESGPLPHSTSSPHLCFAPRASPAPLVFFLHSTIGAKDMQGVQPAPLAQAFPKSAQGMRVERRAIVTAANDLTNSNPLTVYRNARGSVVLYSIGRMLGRLCTPCRLEGLSRAVFCDGGLEEFVGLSEAWPPTT